MSEIEITRLSVALTDILVLIACLLSFYFLNQVKAVQRNIHQNYLILFLCVGMAALSGAIHHQWFEEATDFFGTLPRFVTMISIGYAALQLWLIAGDLVLKGSYQIYFQKIFRILLYAYIGLVVLYEQQFWLAIIFYVPAVFFFLGVAIYRLAQYKEKLHIWAIAGLAVTIIAATIQALQISLIPVYINHNSFYHLVQLPGVYLLYIHAKECANWMPSR